jgi:hypothetical protein
LVDAHKTDATADGGRPDDASADATSADGGADAGPFQPPLIGTFNSETIAFSDNPQATRSSLQLSIGGAEPITGNAIGIAVTDGAGVSAKAYLCSGGMVQMDFLKSGVEWISMVTSPCNVTFTQVPASIGDLATGTFSGTLVRQDGQAGTMDVTNGSFHVPATN